MTWIAVFSSFVRSQCGARFAVELKLEIGIAGADA